MLERVVTRKEMLNILKDWFVNYKGVNNHVYCIYRGCVYRNRKKITEFDTDAPAANPVWSVKGGFNRFWVPRKGDVVLFWYETNYPDFEKKLIDKIKIV